MLVVILQIFECFFSMFFCKHWQDLNFVVVFWHSSSSGLGAKFQPQVLART